LSIWSRLGVRFIGLYTMQCYICNLISIFILSIASENMPKVFFEWKFQRSARFSFIPKYEILLTVLKFCTCKTVPWSLFFAILTTF
jgi:hypothetical protein